MKIELGNGRTNELYFKFDFLLSIKFEGEAVLLLLFIKVLMWRSDRIFAIRCV